MSSIRRKVDRIKMSSEGHETKKFIQVCYDIIIINIILLLIFTLMFI